jgi:hypothetical protein
MLMKSPKQQRDSEPRKNPSLRRRGAIAGLAVALSVATGPLWASPDDSASACQPITAGRAGTLPCERHNTKTDDTIEQVLGTTTTGCVVGFVFGLGAGILPGCVGGLVGNIVW